MTLGPLSRAPGLAVTALQRAGAVRLDPFAPYNFVVEIDGLICGGFSKVEGIGASVSIETYVEGGRHHSPHFLPGAVEWNRLVLTKGLGLVDMLWRWFEATARGVIEPHNGMIMVLGAEGVPKVIWEFHEAIPVVWKGPTLDAESAQVIAIETLELVHQGLTQPLPRAPVVAGVPGVGR